MSGATSEMNRVKRNLKETFMPGVSIRGAGLALNAGIITALPELG